VTLRSLRRHVGMVRAGILSLRRDDSRQHRLWGGRCHRRRGGGCSQGSQRARIYCAFPEGVWDPSGRAWR
jgi:hypothetical protein